MSILIVEDEALIASYIEEVLGESGFRVAGIAASILLYEAARQRQAKS